MQHRAGNVSRAKPCAAAKARAWQQGRAGCLHGGVVSFVTRAVLCECASARSASNLCWGAQWAIESYTTPQEPMCLARTAGDEASPPVTHLS